MSALEVHAEIVRLARLLEVDPHDLAFLKHSPSGDLRWLRRSASDRLFAGDRSLFVRLAGAAKLLPDRLTAFIAETVFGPVLIARIAGEMHAAHAVSIATRMDIGFLASVCLALDPSRAREILFEMPVEVVRAVALELVRRREFITMGSFVDYLSEPVIDQVMDSITDEEDLIRIGLFIETKSLIPKLMQKLSAERLRRCVKLAHDPVKNLFAEALSLMAYADPEKARQLGDMMADEAEADLTRLLHRAHAEDLWGGILPVIARMSPEKQARLVHLDALASTEVLTRLFSVAEEEDLFRLVLPIVASMSDEQLADAAFGADPGKLLRLFRVAEQANLVPKLLSMVGQFSDDERTQLATIAAAMPAELHDTFVATVDEADLWQPLFEVARAIPKLGRDTLGAAVRRIAQQRPDLLEKLAPLAEANGLADFVAAARMEHAS